MKTQRSLIIIAVILIVASALSRLALYPYNFSPMIAMALFGGAVLRDKKYAVALPILAMFLSDVLFEVLHIAPGFWGWGQLVGYGIMILITFIGSNIRKVSAVKVGGFSILSSVIFFLLSNSSFFILDNPIYHTYSQDMNGYFNCLAGGLPFLLKGGIADLVYSGILFGTYVLSMKEVARREMTAVKSL